MIFWGDIHCDSKVGNILSRNLLDNKIDKIIELTNKQDKCVMMGDYFNPSNPENRSREYLASIINRINVPIIMLIGNHDRDKFGSSSLAAIKPLLRKDINIVEDFFEEDNMCYISYCLDFEHIKNVIINTKCKYIVGHFAFGYELRGKKLNEIEYDNKFEDKVFILSHIHKHQIIKNINYTGAIVITNLGELDYNFKLLLLDSKTGVMEWKNIKYDLNNITINNLSELGDANENTKVTIEVDSIEEKNKMLEQLKDKKLLDVKFKIKNTGIDISVLKIESMVKEYLKIQGREDLYDKVMSYIPAEKR